MYRRRKSKPLTRGEAMSLLTVIRQHRLFALMGVYVHSDLSRQREAVAQLDSLLGTVLG